MNSCFVSNLRVSVAYLGLFSALAGSLFLCSCKPEAPFQAESPPRPVKVLELSGTGLARHLEYPGQITAARQSRKAFEVEGRIIEMPVKEGQPITNGQVLAKLDPRDYQAAVDSAEAQFKTARKVVERLQTLVEKGSVSRQEIDLALREQRTAEAQLQRAKKALEETTMRADFDGRVAELLVEDFAYVNAKEVVMVIQDESQLEIEFDLPETVLAVPIPGANDSERVKNVHPVVVLSAIPGQEFPARFSEGSRNPDPVTRTYRVKLAFDAPDDYRVTPGMTAMVRAELPASTFIGTDGFPVPAGAVIAADGGRGRVWRIDPETMKVSAVEVELGAVVGDRVVISGPLEKGDRLAVSGVHHLREGDEVRAWKHP